MKVFCAVCGTTRFSTYIGHGDGDYLCSTCDDWRQFFVDRERKSIARDHEAEAWVDAWRLSLTGHRATFPPERRRTWT